MVKKNRTSTVRTPSRSKLNLEEVSWFTPVTFGLLFLFLIVLFRDFVFSDKMLYMSDQIQAGVFFRMFLIDTFTNTGSFPQWMPYIFGGMPYVEAFHGDIFYPLSMMKLFASNYQDYIRIQGWTMILHIYLAGVFMYLCARRFNLSKIPSLISAVGYMFAPYIVSLVAPGHDGKIYVTTLFPLVILFIELGFSSSLKILWFSLLGLVIGFIILSPHPQMSYFMLWAVSFYALFKLIFLFKESGSIAPLVKPGLLTAYAVVIGLFLSAIQFYPGYLYTNEYSPRADTKQGWEWATSWSLHEEEVASLIVPEFSGTKSTQVKTYYWGKNFFKDNSESVGVISIFLALIGFFFSRRKEAYFFGGLGLFALAYALAGNTPFFYVFFYLIPKVKSMRAASMIMFIFSFSITLLAGMAVQYLIDLKGNSKKIISKRFNYLLFGFPSGLFVLALLFSVAGRGMLSVWTSIFYSDASTIAVQQGVTKFDLAMLNLPQIISGCWFSFLFTALAACVIWLYRNGRGNNVVLTGIIILIAINGFRFDSRFIDTVEPKQYWGGNPITSYFQQNPGNYRVMNFGVLPEDLLPFFGIEMVVGYHGNQLRWYDNLLGGPGKTNQANPRFLNLAGAEYILIPSSGKFPDNFFGDKPITVAADFGQAKILHNPNAIPRVFLANNFRLFKNHKNVVNEVLIGNDNFRDIVYLEDEPVLEISKDSLMTDSAWIKSYSPDSLVIGVNCKSNRILVLTDNYYDAWQVWIDGNQGNILRAYGSFRAVEIPAGTKEVSFKFISERYIRGRLVSGLTSLFLLLIIGFYIFKGFVKKESDIE